MTEITTPQPTTDAFFGLEDRWLETAPGELTHYHEIGSGTPVLFLHGSGTGVSAAANWWLNLEDIGRENRAIAIDLIGFGQTVVPEDAVYGIQAWVEHAVRVLDALGIEKTWLVGNSLGGWVAFQFAIDHPERLAGIISMGTGGAKRTKALTSHATPELTVEGIHRTLTDFVVDHSLVTEELVQARYRASKTELASSRFREVITARDRDREQLPLDFSVLAQLQVPVLLIHGREDAVIPASRSLELANIIPHADLHLFSQCGHWSQVERVADFNATVRGYLAIHGKDGQTP
ncbi:2-hydroxymuconate-semialdehyde hydrolase [Arthrobacter ginsengisoli]|uniref:2-hydroxymuconate-semialdehyde hydrolase n=1 Tax=Arthrobacter ginsengisoli TaxID=1356565 RepID=A0ABU1UDV8_9MICC|nr:alpha/beta fold hydrolase [Arthrobacter ginsengisoli]MDR7083384.1 2-hydroxymuconate-semialdehyde hydrolase [Arthrobacter ginsengisoli]